MNWPGLLMWFDRDKGVWNRFDRDNLAGVDPKDLAVLPQASVVFAKLNEALEASDRHNRRCIELLDEIIALRAVLVRVERFCYQVIPFRIDDGDLNREKWHLLNAVRAALGMAPVPSPYPPLDLGTKGAGDDQHRPGD